MAFRHTNLKRQASGKAKVRLRRPRGASCAVFWNFQSSAHQAHNSNISEIDKNLWLKAGKSLPKKHATTKIVSTYLFYFFRQLACKLQNRSRWNCSFWSNFRLYWLFFAARRLSAASGGPIAVEFDSATKKHRLGPPCKVSARRGPLISRSKQFSIEILVQTIIGYLHFESGLGPSRSAGFFRTKSPNSVTETLMQRQKVPQVDQTSLLSVL